jgi:Xaa-Pro aminopeptidase
MKCKRNVSLAVTIIAICLITTATHAQRSGTLVLRFRVPFPFTVENKTFAAGEYEVTQPTQLTLGLRNVENQASAFEHVQPAGSSKEVDGRARAVFHRYGKSYFLAAISDGSWQSTYDFHRSNKEAELIAKDPTRRLEVVNALSNGTVVTAESGRK